MDILVVCYDIEDNNKRKELYKFLKGYGGRGVTGQRIRVGDQQANRRD